MVLIYLVGKADLFGFPGSRHCLLFERKIEIERGLGRRDMQWVVVVKMKLSTKFLTLYNY